MKESLQELSSLQDQTTSLQASLQAAEAKVELLERELSIALSKLKKFEGNEAKIY